MKKLVSIGLLLVLVSSGCQSVSVSLDGASIPENVSTVSVSFFEIQAPLTNPNFPQIITEGLRDKFIRQTRLKLVPQDGDVQFSGVITGYGTSPVAISGNETSARTRLTITISVEYQNIVDDSQNFTQSFSRFSDFDATQSLSNVESGLMTEISEQLVQDIFNKAFLNW